MAGKDAPSKGKTALKSPGSMKGKDSSKRVQFLDSSDEEDFVDEMDFAPSNTEKGSTDSLKSGKRSSLDSLKSGVTGAGNGGKGGINHKTGKAGGKDSVPTGVPNMLMEAPKLVFDLPKNAELLMDCEAVAVLEEIQDFLPSLLKDPLMKISPAFNKALQVAQNGECYTNPDSVKEVLKKLQLKGVSDCEVCMIANICPETIDEVYALIPSLKVNRQTNEEALKEALKELEKLKKCNK